MNDEWLSAHLDGELTDDETALVDAALATDADLVAELAAIAAVRSALRDSTVEPRPGALDRIHAAVAADGEAARPPLEELAPVISLERRRRVPTLAAAAAVFAIIAGVVSGLGGSSGIPALGDFIDQHEAAAAVLEGAPMPDEMDHLDPMPMDEAETMSPVLPSDYSMEKAFVDETTVHLVYRSVEGEPVSVFRVEGDADVGELGEGSVVTSDGTDMWSAPMKESYVAVIDGQGYVWIVVSDGPQDDMMGDMMDDLPSRSPSFMDRVRDAADAVVEPFRL